MTTRILRLVTLPAVLSLGATALSAQTTVIDEGTFRISVRGTPVGTETFTIRRSGTGASTTTVAQGRVVLDSGEQTRAVLQLEGTGLRPAAYQIEVTGPGQQRITGKAAGNRFRATIVSSAGEQMREYLTSEGAIVLDDGVAHQYYFLAAIEGSASVPVIIPRQSRQLSARISAAGSDRITVGGQPVDARKIRVEPQGLPARLVWVDSQNRVLRLEIPDERFVAERTARP